MDIRELDRRAVLTTTEIVNTVAGDHLERQTPCSGWNLRKLLAHMVGQHEGFAVAATGEPTRTPIARFAMIRRRDHVSRQSGPGLGLLLEGWLGELVHGIAHGDLP